MPPINRRSHPLSTVPCGTVLYGTVPYGTVPMGMDVEMYGSE
jgi:hypothetical protein